ncbi:MAG: hypothetical protein ACWGPR_08450 [Candidatus Deferrimicrobiaceae bacterium]
MSMDDKQGQALELLRELAGADPDTVIAQMDAVADKIGDDAESLAQLNGALGALRVRVKSMQLALAPHMSRLAAAESAKRKAGNMTNDEKRAMAQHLALEGIAPTSKVHAPK